MTINLSYSFNIYVKFQPRFKQLFYVALQTNWILPCKPILQFGQNSYETFRTCKKKTTFLWKQNPIKRKKLPTNFAILSFMEKFHNDVLFMGVIFYILRLWAYIRSARGILKVLHAAIFCFHLTFLYVFMRFFSYSLS